MKIHDFFTSALIFASFSALTAAHDFDRLDQALPSNHVISGLEPVFDFDGDGCLPSAGISRSGQRNGGLNTTGGITSGCRSSDFLRTSNTLHRYACTSDNSGNTFCADFYALYFEKDQVDRGGFLGSLGAGHRHDWEYVAIWTKNGAITHGSYSAHGDLYTRPRSELPFEGTHVKFVYHKEGVATHAFRFAGNHESAENPYGRFVTPTITSWYEMTGDGVTNIQMRNRLNQFNYGSASIPMKDQGQKFINNLNEFRPSGYPSFSFSDAQNSNPNPEEIQLFSDCHFQGNIAILPLGEFGLAALEAAGMPNDTISSMKNPEKLKVYMADNAWFGGSNLRTTANRVDCLVEHNLNDRVSSMTVRRP